jgi:hypothetical protein
MVVPQIESRVSALEGAGGITIDFDVPMLKDVVFSQSGGYIHWTAGSLTYGGHTYPVNAHSSNVGGTTVHFDLADLPDPPAAIDLIAAGNLGYAPTRWFFCYKDADNAVYPVLQSPIINGGLIQAQTITAAQILGGTITTSQLNFTPVLGSSIIASINASG